MFVECCGLVFVGLRRMCLRLDCSVLLWCEEIGVMCC